MNKKDFTNILTNITQNDIKKASIHSSQSGSSESSNDDLSEQQKLENFFLKIKSKQDTNNKKKFEKLSIKVVSENNNGNEKNLALSSDNFEEFFLGDEIEIQKINKNNNYLKENNFNTKNTIHLNKINSEINNVELKFNTEKNDFFNKIIKDNKNKNI
jgi:hypothetical protein